VTYDDLSDLSVAEQPQQTVLITTQLTLITTALRLSAPRHCTIARSHIPGQGDERLREEMDNLSALMERAATRLRERTIELDRQRTLRRWSLSLFR
jgi:hypothetical protein